MMNALDVVVVGGGQAGLAMGYELAQRGYRFVILEAAPAIGQTWRERYDSLTLFTPAQYSSLPGMPFPKPADTYPRKDEVAAYLERYVAAFKLPVRLNTRVVAVREGGPGFVVETAAETYAARSVVVATGPFQQPFTPPFAADLAPTILQLHSSAYRNPGQLPPGPVLVVGAGNSGVQIAEELAQTHEVTLAVGKRPPTLPQRLLGRDIFWWLHRLGLMQVPASSLLGRRMRRLDPLIGTDLGRLTRERRVRLVGRALGASGATVRFADGQDAPFASVIWATGFRPSYVWLDVPVLDPHGTPVHQRGVTEVPGFYFVGLSWLHRRGSALLGGVGSDAAFLASHIAERLAAPSVEQPAAAY
ncbi:MAG TPA: FAD-dependent oxidoreductase [Chloroflexaceae bacterium]|nr:FAD-dependent oxidoreductase [Chloroflexaceae bacterium]